MYGRHSAKNANGKIQDMSSKIENEREMKIMFTKEELQLLKGLVKVSIGGTNRMIKDLERNKQRTAKQEDMLKAFLKSREFKQNLIAKLEKLEGVAENEKSSSI